MAWDSFSSIQACTSLHVLFSSQRSTEQPSHWPSSHCRAQFSRIEMERVTSDSVGALMTPPGIMNDECGH